ncbi:hypothetical protein JKF63_04594 [Porcisia hertigi]|uniref:Uncharacterized protein n=1 Tax=Porcisia hertigi TaxID=2761500 RepID=A0A836IPU2_9TRYP|nr:hypothetical protein JKF63_04594 [Porcisia hertigi]
MEDHDHLLYENCTSNMDRGRIDSPLPLSSGVTLEEENTMNVSAVKQEAFIAPAGTLDNADVLAQEPEGTTGAPSATTTMRGLATSPRVKRSARGKRKRNADAPPPAVLPEASPGPAGELSLELSLTTDSTEHNATDIRNSGQDGSDELGKEKYETRRVAEQPERNSLIATGVLTRRAKIGNQDAHASIGQERPRDDENSSTAASGLGGPGDPLGEVHETRGRRLRSQSTPQPTWTEASLSSTASSSALAAKQEEEAWEAATQAAIDAQERQLRLTLLSIFPPALLQDAEAGRTLAKGGNIRDVRETCEIKNVNDAQSRRVNAGLAPLCSSFATPSFSPEPLLPLLQALCEDKAYVHGAWCRYEDDIAVRRAQNSIQRKRQRHSFSKGGRKAPAREPTAVARRRDDVDDGSGDQSSADEEEAEEDELQPPESHWVEAPPAFTGGPRSLSTNGTHCARVSAVTGGFQWTPWQFYRDKRRRVSRRPTDNGVSSSPARPATVAGIVQSGLFSASPSNTPVSGNGGVPSLAFSEAPSLPVLQVEADVPESAETVLTPMTPEERKGYARYVMSSGKLRHDCRDPYMFLVSRAKAMRIQWRRQHPIN